LLKETLTKQGLDYPVALHVAGENRGRDSKRSDRSDRGRGRDRHSNDRRSNDRRSNDRGSSRTDKRDEDRLKSLAKKLAHKVLKSGEAVVIEKELNGFQRRLVHVTVQNIDGVGTESFMDGETKKIRILLAEGQSNQQED